MSAEILNFGVQLKVGPVTQHWFDEYHTDLADVRLRALFQLLLEAFERRKDSSPFDVPTLLQDAAKSHADVGQLLKFLVAHGVPRGLGEALEEAVHRISDGSESHKALIGAIEVSVFGKRVAINHLS